MFTRILVVIVVSVGALLPGVVSAAAPPVTHETAGLKPQGGAGWTSSHWSGYAHTTARATFISGRWGVPSVTRTSGDTYSSTWVGIDGFTQNDNNLIQVGTEQDWVSGHSRYFAWWEILPAFQTRIPMTVQPGDIMNAVVFIDPFALGTTWDIELDDLTQNTHFYTQQNYTGPGASVEWIMEAPTLRNGATTLAHYSTTYFDFCEYNNQNPPAFAAGDRGVLVSNRKPVSTPSLPDSDSDGFAISYGAKPPVPNPS